MKLTKEQINRAYDDMERMANKYLSDSNREIRDLALYALAYINLVKMGVK
jgi:hypothetical protein